MKLLSINVRGLAVPGRKGAVQSLLKLHSIDWLCLQETKQSVVERSLVSQLWHHNDFDWAYSPSNGSVGGLLSTWSSAVFLMDSVTVAPNILIVEGKCRVTDEKLIIFNVYAPTRDAPAKRDIWLQISGVLCCAPEIACCVVGDFNTVRAGEERLNYVGPVTHEMQEFNDFILDNSLVDLPLQRFAYTWLNGRGTSASRIDRFLLSERWMEKWPNLVEVALELTIADHRPILLHSPSGNWGPKAFRTLDCWDSHPDFNQFVAETWTTIMPTGSRASILHCRIKHIRQALKVWNREVFGMADRQIEEISAELNWHDSESETRALSLMEIESRRLLANNLKLAQQRCAAIIYQKARQRRIREGDGNTGFFHACVRKRRHHNAIQGMSFDGVWTDSIQEVKGGIRSFFEKHFKEPAGDRPFIALECDQCLSVEDNVQLIVPFSEKEIFATLYSCSSKKSLGPDGLNFHFVKTHWNTVKQDFIGFLTEFYYSCRLMRELNATSIVLAAKVLSPTELGHYRPISLIGCAYKLLAKLLANRLRKVMNKLISPQQLAFISGRHIHDGVLLASELLHYVQSQGMPAIFFKVDFAKAFDSMNWSFLLHMMRKMGFGAQWIGWMRTKSSRPSLSRKIGCPNHPTAIPSPLSIEPALNNPPFADLFVGVCPRFNRGIELIIET